MPYKPKTKFELKDGYPQDDPRKIIYGAEFAVEFEAISATFADVQGGFDQVKDKLEAGGYSMEEAPAGGIQYGRQEVNGTMKWTEVGSAGGITDEERAKLNEAHGWGNHANAGYIKQNDTIFGGSYRN